MMDNLIEKCTHNLTKYELLYLYLFVCIQNEAYTSDFSWSRALFWHWQEHTQTCGDMVFRVFDRVVVQLTIDQSNLQHLKLQTRLVEPKVCLIATSNCLLIDIH